MNRLGIVVLYDAHGIIDSYVEFLLSSLQSEIQEYIIVINGYMNNESMRKLRQYTTKIYIRENIGFDAGAYKDTFLKFVPQNIWRNYDEIVLMNDTFFGPVTPMEETWKLFDSDNVDFWGITRHPKQELPDGSIIYSHIQSYFITIKSRIITSRYFLEFWEKLSYPKTYQEVVENFEIKFTKFFESKGFNGKSLMDLKEGIVLGEKTENPCFHSYELLKEFHVPFLKKRFLNFNSEVYINMIDALEYIEKETYYNTDLIWESLYRLSKEQGEWSIFISYFELEKFYSSHTRIYIYGAGKYAKKIQRYFQCRGWKYECFLVSDNAEEFQECKNFKDVNITPTDGIILALGRKAFYEVYPVIKDEVGEAQLMIPNYLK